MELKKTDRGMTIGGGLIVWVAMIAAYILSDYHYFSLPFLTMLWHGVLLILADIFGVLLVASFATVPFTMLVEAYAPDRAT